MKLHLRAMEDSPYTECRPDCTAHPNCLLRKSQLPGGSSSGLEPVTTRAEGQWH